MSTISTNSFFEVVSFPVGAIGLACEIDLGVGFVKCLKKRKEEEKKKKRKEKKRKRGMEGKEDNT